MVPLERNLSGHPFAALLFDERTSLLDHENMGCTQRECKPNEDKINQFLEMFESRISLTATEKIPGCEALDAKTAWCFDMEGHAKKCVGRYCELANNKTQQLYTVPTLCSEDHTLNKGELETVGKLSDVCSQIVFKCVYLARIGRPDTLWSVNKLVRAVTKWTRACDRRYARLISKIDPMNDYRQYCSVGNTAQHCRLVCSKTPIFLETLKIQNQLQGESYVFWEVEQLFPLVGCARKNISGDSQVHRIRD